MAFSVSRAVTAKCRIYDQSCRILIGYKLSANRVSVVACGVNRVTDYNHVSDPT